MKEREIIDFAKKREELKSASCRPVFVPCSPEAAFLTQAQIRKALAERHGNLQMSIQKPDEALETLQDGAGGAANRCIRVNSTIRIPL